MENARPATKADLDLIASLWAEAVNELGGQRGGTLLARALDRRNKKAVARAALRDHDRFLAIGEFDGIPVGFASLWCDRTAESTVGMIEVVYVEPPARKVGVGEAIVQLCVQWCREKGCVGIDAPALPGSRPAKAFFEDNGFVARLLVMHHRLDQSGDGSLG